MRSLSGQHKNSLFLTLNLPPSYRLVVSGIWLFSLGVFIDAIRELVPLRQIKESNLEFFLKLQSERGFSGKGKLLARGPFWHNQTESKSLSTNLFIVATWLLFYYYMAWGTDTSSWGVFWPERRNEMNSIKQIIFPSFVWRAMNGNSGRVIYENKIPRFSLW